MKAKKSLKFGFVVGICFLGAMSWLLPSATRAQTLSVQVSADPSSGPAPLNNVDLTAEVSGTASGPITYKFDCTGDGSWERTYTTNLTSYTASDLCNYDSPGTYVAKIEVEREGLAFQGATAILVQAGNSLSVTLSADPSSGPAPLNNVDLTAEVSGTASGPITYKFDCTGDGSWERTYTTNLTSYTASDLCNYDSPGTYVARVSVNRGGLSFQGSTTIKAVSPEHVVEVQKKARNISRGQQSFVSYLLAEPSDRLEFEITLEVKEKVEKIILRDTLSELLRYKDKLEVDTASYSGNIISGLQLDEVLPGKPVTVRFEAEVVGPENFVSGRTKLVNTVIAFSTKGSASDAMTVVVDKKVSPTMVSTGVWTLGKFALFVAVIGFFLASYLFLFKYYFATNLLPLARKGRSERQLAIAIRKARKKARRKARKYQVRL